VRTPMSPLFIDAFIVSFPEHKHCRVCGGNVSNGEERPLGLTPLRNITPQKGGKQWFFVQRFD
jgi:hypothetical protein